MFAIRCEKSTVKWSRWIVKLDAMRHVRRERGHSWFETGKPFRLIIDEKTSSIVGLSRVIHPHVSHTDMNEPFVFASKFKMSIVWQIVKSKSFHGGTLNIASRRLQYFKPVQQDPDWQILKGKYSFVFPIDSVKWRVNVVWVRSSAFKPQWSNSNPSESTHYQMKLPLFSRKVSFFLLYFPKSEN